MQTTITLDDALLAKAQACTGITDESRVIHEALKALIARDSGQLLAGLGGSEQALAAPLRRRPKRGWCRALRR